MRIFVDLEGDAIVIYILKLTFCQGIAQRKITVPCAMIPLACDIMCLDFSKEIVLLLK